MLQDQVKREHEEKQAVPYVAEHDSEQKGERDDREQSRVDFSVSRNAVSVDDQLEWKSEVVRLDVGWRRHVSLGRVAEVGSHL